MKIDLYPFSTSKTGLEGNSRSGQTKAFPVMVIVTSVFLGVFLGVSSYTFFYAEGLSYFSKDPKACVNCHIMQPQFDSWQKSSHHTVANCVDCHLPHDFIPKYISKADNGFFHSKGFTFQDFKEPIQIKKRNSKILQKKCIECHQEITHTLVSSAKSDVDSVDCIHCHRDVGHGETVGLGGRDLGFKNEKEKSWNLLNQVKN